MSYIRTRTAINAIDFKGRKIPAKGVMLHSWRVVSCQNAGECLSLGTSVGLFLSCLFFAISLTFSFDCAERTEKAVCDELCQIKCQTPEHARFNWNLNVKHQVRPLISCLGWFSSWGKLTNCSYLYKMERISETRGKSRQFCNCMLDSCVNL